jgi:hypothetical protein
MIDLDLLFGSQDTVDGTQIVFRVFPRKGRARWMLEKHYRRPWHLKTWPRANARARIINRMAWVLSWFGLHLPSRCMSVVVTDDSPYAELRRKFDHIGIFLGTPGPNRKIVVFAERFDRSVFVKIPLAPKSVALTRNEITALSQLAEDPALAPIVPKVCLFAGYLGVDNVERDGTIYGELSVTEVERVHNIFFARSHITKNLQEIRGNWDEEARMLQDGAHAVAHSKDIVKLIATTRAAAKHFLDCLDPAGLVECYMAHGDFTRWNVFVTSGGTARVIDWELYGLRPRYFDLIHYFVSSDILMKRLGAKDILKHLEKIGQRLISLPSDTGYWFRYIGLYFSRQSLHYTVLYGQQAELHEQARWQLYTWRDALAIVQKRLAKIVELVPEGE